MLATSYTPTRIYNSSNNNQRGHKYAINPKLEVEPRSKKYQIVETVKLERMRHEIDTCKCAKKKLKLLTTWSLRSTKSTLSDLHEILGTLEELYGDEAFNEL